MIRGNKSHITIFLILGFVENFGVRKIFLIESLPNITRRSLENDRGNKSHITIFLTLLFEQKRYNLGLNLFTVTALLLKNWHIH